MLRDGYKSVAIDGPVGSGKSSISKRAAKDLGFVHIDTGAIYRAVGLFVLRRGVDPKSESEVSVLLPEIDIDVRCGNGGQSILLCGENVSKDIRLNEVSRYASDVSAHPAVRAFLLDMQRKLASDRDVVMDGRDIGTVILPHASLKIYLTAAPEDRAQRRYEELLRLGQEANFEEVLEALKLRDSNDMNRPVAPLRPAHDAVVLDTTGNTWEQSVELVERTIRERLG